MIPAQVDSRIHFANLVVNCGWCNASCPNCYVPHKNCAYDYTFMWLEGLFIDPSNCPLQPEAIVLSLANDHQLIKEISSKFGDSILCSKPDITLAIRDVEHFLTWVIHSGINLQTWLGNVKLVLSNYEGLVPLLAEIDYRKVNVEIGIIDNGSPLSASQIKNCPFPIYRIIPKPAEALVSAGTNDLCLSYMHNDPPCPAGTQHFSAWPDGRITGCPYRRFHSAPLLHSNLNISQLFFAPYDSWVQQIRGQMRNPDPYVFCPANYENGYKFCNQAQLQRFRDSL